MTSTEAAPTSGEQSDSVQKTPKELKLEKRAAIKDVERAARNEKRKQKQLEKREKKANQPKRPKSIAVLKAERKKRQGAPPRRDKSERTMNRLLARSKKLEFQAMKMLEESKQAYAKYQSLLEHAAKKAEREKKDADYDINISDDDSSEDESSDSNSEEEEQNISSAESNSSTDSNLETAAVNAETTAHEGAVSRKTRRESDAASVRSHLSEADPESNKEKSLLKKKKKSKKSKEPEPEPEPEAEPELEPEAEAEEPEAPAESPEAEEEEPALKAKKPKKDKKEKTKKRKSIDTPMNDADDEVPQEEAQDEKKKRKRKSATEEGEEPATEKKSKKSKTQPKAADDATVESWNVDQLEGGDARQAKMLRLLGGKKNGVKLGGGSKSSGGKLDSAKAEADLQRQFETGMAAKHEGGPKRRGLGA